MHLIAAHWSNADHTLSRWHHDFTLVLCSQGFLQHRTLKHTETKFHVVSSLWLHNMISWFPWFHRFAQNVTFHLHHLGLCMRLPFPTLDSWSSTWNIMHPWAWFSWKRLGKEKPPFFFGTLPFQIPSWPLWGCIVASKKCGLFIGFSCQFRHRVIHRDGLRWLAGDIWDHFPHFLMVQVNCTTSATCSSLGFSTSGMNYSKIIQSLPKKSKIQQVSPSAAQVSTGAGSDIWTLLLGEISPSCPCRCQ